MANLHPFVLEMKTMLANMDTWLAAATKEATAKKFDVAVLSAARLAPDQYPLFRQVQCACDAAKLAAARLAGKPAPVHTDDEQSFEELRARITEVVAYMDAFTSADFEGAETRKVPLSFVPGKKGTHGVDYLVHFAQPNFYFHVTHAYAILRHNGVPLGKMDYMGAMPPLLDL